jgi:hypothetical protein
MGQGDWTSLGGGALSGSQVSQGVYSAGQKPNGGGQFTYGFNALQNVVGVAGIFDSDSPFSVMAYGGIISFAVMRQSGAFTTGFAPFAFIGSANGLASDFAYMLGLADSEPSQIVLRKGQLNGGLPNTAPTLGIGAQPNGCNMRQGSVQWPHDTWVHLMMNVAVQADSSAVISVYQNDLTQNPVTAPVWNTIPGMLPVTDDALQINTGSAPLIPFGAATSKAGIACYVTGISRIAQFDQFTLREQNAP